MRWCLCGHAPKQTESFHLAQQKPVEPPSELISPFCRSASTRAADSLVDVAETLVSLVEQVSASLEEQCDFISSVLGEDMKSNPLQLVELYNTFWRTYSAGLQRLDLEFQGVSTVVNNVYKDIEKNDDKEDLPFSFLKLGSVLWRYKVYKKNQKTLLKGSESLLKQLLRLIKQDMMKKMR